MSEDCHGCIGAIKKQREYFRKIINKARELAKEENKTIIIYRADNGDITLEKTGDIYSYVTPFM